MPKLGNFATTDADVVVSKTGKRTRKKTGKRTRKKIIATFAGVACTVALACGGIGVYQKTRAANESAVTNSAMTQSRPDSQLMASVHDMDTFPAAYKSSLNSENADGSRLNDELDAAWLTKGIRYPISQELSPRRGSVEFATLSHAVNDSSASNTPENTENGAPAQDVSDLMLIPTGEYVNVKYLMVDDIDEMQSMTIKKIWSSEDSAQHVLTQQPGVAELYACDENPDWYFAYATPTVQNGVGNRIIDASAALDDVNGQAIDGVIYDKDTGIAMIPASAIENKDVKRMQLQFLQLVTLADEGTTHATMDVSISSSNNDISNSVNAEQQIRADAFDRMIEIPLFQSDANATDGQDGSEASLPESASSLSLDDFEAFFDGMRVRIDEDTAAYDAKRGVLVLGYSPVGIGRIGIAIHDPNDPIGDLLDTVMGVEKADAAYVIGDGDISFFNNGRTFLDRIPVSALRPGASYTYSAPMRACIGGGEGGIYGKAAGYYDEGKMGINVGNEGSNEDFARRIRDGASWEEIRSSKGPWHTTYGTGYQVVEAEGPWNKSFGGLDWHTIGSGIAGNLGLDCSHIDSAAGNAPHDDYQWFTGNMFMRILRVVDNGTWSYVIVGFQSPNIHNGIDQDGKYFNQAGSGLYKIRLSSSGKVKINKTSNGNSELGIGRGSAAAGCVFGVYEDAATTKLVDKGTTDPSGNLTFLIEPYVTRYVKELSAPWPHVVNDTVYSVNAAAGETKSLSVTDDTSSVLQISKTKRPQNGTYAATDVAFPMSSSQSRVTAKATVSGQNNVVGYEARIVASGEDCSSLSFEIPREITPSDNMKITCGDEGVTATINRNGQKVTVNGLTSGREYAISFTGNVKRGWASTATRARLLVVNCDNAASQVAIDARLSGNTMSGAQYTIYADEACTIEAGDYDLSIYPTQVEAFHIYESLNNGGNIRMSADAVDGMVSPRWRAVPLSSGVAALVSTSSNLALDWDTATDKQVLRTCKLGSSTAQQWRIDWIDAERAILYLGPSSMIFHARGTVAPYSANEAAAWNQVWHMRKTTGSSTITIGSNGIGKWGNSSGQYLLPGRTYYVKETKAPAGYDVDETVHKVKANGNGVVNLDVTDTYTTIEIRKQTRYPDFVFADSRYEIQGARYGLYDKDPSIAGALPIATMVTDANGIARADHLKAGTRYYVKELSASKGLLLDGETHACDARAGTLNVIDLIEEIPVKVQISKRSSAFVPNVAAYSLAGAQFALYTSEDDARNKRNPARIITTGTDGNTPNETVPMRDYWIREVKAPYGYHISDEIQTITASEFQESSSQSLMFEDAPRDIELSLWKTTDPLTKAEGYFSSLAGAQFGIYATMSDAQDEVNPLATVVTDKDGKANLAPLPPAEYYFVRETTPPEHYVRNESVFTIHVTDKLEISREVYDDGVPVDISIVKSSRDASVLQSNYSLSGATFGIYTSELDALNRTNPVKEVITDANGKCPTVTGLHARDYWVSEVAPPNGFYLEADPIHVRFPSSASATASFAEDPIYGYIRVQKLSDDPYATPDVNSSLFSYQNMTVAVFDTYQKAASAAFGSSAGALFTMKTDAKGFAVSTIPLVPGDYYLREVAAPTGYEVTRKVIHTKAVPQAEKNAMLASCLQLASVNDAQYDLLPFADGWNEVAGEEAPVGSLPEMASERQKSVHEDYDSIVSSDSIATDIRNNEEPSSYIANDELLENHVSRNVHKENTTRNVDMLDAPELPPIGGDFTSMSELPSYDGTDRTGKEPLPFVPDAPVIVDYKLSYELNSGSSVPNSDLDEEYVIRSDPTKASKFSISETIPTREGWKFRGWITRVPSRCNLSPLIVEPGQELENLAFVSGQNPEEWDDLPRSLASYAEQDGTNEIVLVAIWENENTDESDTGGIEVHKMTAMTSSTSTSYLWRYRYGNRSWLYLSASEPKYNDGGWLREGQVCEVPTWSESPLYELKNPYAGDYFYTTSSYERDNVIANGWGYMGIKCYTDDAGGTPIHRYYYDPDYGGDGSHYLTTSTSIAGWRYEGVGFYGIARFSISYSGNGATSGSTSSQTGLQYGISYSLRSNGFSRTGYHFNNWYTNSAGSANGYYNAGASFTNRSDNHTGNVTMYAQWGANTYTIKFNGNGNTGGSMSNLGMTYDVSKNLTSNGFTRKGYSFAGWATSPTGNVVYGNGASVRNLTSTNGGTVNLYAKWTERPYYVKFDANGGTGSMPNQKFLVDVAQNLSANKFTKANCTFVGWAKTKPYGNVRVVKAQWANQQSVTNLTSQNNTITLYAVWKSTLTPDKTATTIYDPPKKTSIQIDKVISGFVPTTDFDATHSLAGATFGIYNSSADASANRNAVATVTTDKYGHASWDGAQVGATYYVKETKAPSNGRFNVDASVKSAKVSVEGTPASLVFTETTNTTATGTLKIAKRIAGDNVASKAGIGGTWNVSGCTFGIYATSANAQARINPIQIVSVPASGDVTVSLMPGTYYVRELKAADGLGIDSSIKTVAVTANATKTTSFADPKRTMGITITKENSSPELTKDVPGSHYSLTGAVFGLYDSEAAANAGTPELATMTTGADGKASISGIYPKTYYVKEKKAPEGFTASTKVYVVEPASSGNTEVSVPNVPVTSLLSVKKSSDCGELESWSGKMSLAGAVYDVFSNEALTDKVASLTTDEAGNTSKITLYPGKYWIRESAAPMGHNINDTVYEADLTGGCDKVVEASDHAPMGTISLTKSSNHPEWLDNDLSGATFGIFADAECESIVREIVTDESGNAKSGWLPIGRYYVRELAALYGHAPDGNTYEVDVTDGNDVAVNEGSPIENLTGSLLLCKNGSGDIPAELRLSLSDAVYGIYEMQECTGEPLVRISTGEDGQATANLLRPGTYWVKEESAPDGYAIDEQIHEIVVSPNVQARLDVSEEPATTTMNIRLVKMNAETGIIDSRKAASCRGALFSMSFYPKSAKDDDAPARTWNVRTGEDGTTLLAEEFLVEGSDELYTDGEGNTIIPDGKLIIREIEPPAGYAVDATPQEFVVESGLMFDSEGTAHAGEITVSFKDMPLRSDLMVKKVDDAGNPISGIPFALSLLGDDGQPVETHVLVSDDNGIVTTARGGAAEANANDPLLFVYRDSDGATFGLEEDEPKLGEKLEILSDEELNPAAGVWFSGASGNAIAFTDGKGRLVPGDYVLTEVGCDANDKYTLAEPVRFTADGKGNVVLDDIVNVSPIVAWTNAHDRTTQSKFGTSMGTHVDDLVHYDNLTPGEEYLLSGTMCDVDTGKTLLDASWTPLTTIVPFTPDSEEGELVMSYDTSSFDVTGLTMSINLKLSHQNLDKQVHNELLDDVQETIMFPKITTSAIDAATGKHYGMATNGGTVTIEDTVTYENLEVGSRYYLQGTLHHSGIPDGENKYEDLGTLRGEDGEELVVEIPFTPKAANGTQKVRFEVPASEVLGKYRITAYEKLLNQDRIVVETHEDITDEAQTIYYPQIDTYARDKSTDTNIGTFSSDGIGTVIDEVSWEEFGADADYKVVGYVVDAETGERITGMNGEKIETERSIAKDAENSYTMEITGIPMEKVRNTKIVVCEDIYDANGSLVATHRDLKDHDQTISYPTMDTTALDKVTSDHIGYAHASGEDVTIVDTMTFEGVFDETEYDHDVKITATAYDAKTGEAIVGRDGKVVTATVTYPLQSLKAGDIATNEITLPQENVLGKNVNIHEIAEIGGRVMSYHADNADLDQTVSYPNIATSAGGYDANASMDDIGKSVPANQFGKLYDDIEYEHMMWEARDYKVKTWFVDAETGEVARDRNGHEIRNVSVKTISEQEGSWRVDLKPDFALYRLLGHKLVCFEEIYLIGHDGQEFLVAEHKDINDANQTIELIYPTDTYEMPLSGIIGIDDNTFRTLMLALLACAGTGLIIVLMMRQRHKRRCRRDMMGEE